MASRNETRARLLETGRDMIRETGLPETLDIRIADVCARATMTTGAAYNIWQNQDDYRRDLAVFLASDFGWADTNTIFEATSTLGPTSTMDDWVTAVCEAYFPVFTQNRDFYLILHYWGVDNPSPRLTTAIRDGYNTIHTNFLNLYTATIARYGLTVTPPHTLDDITTLITANLEGLAIRHRFQPERITTPHTHLFTSIVLAITHTYLQPAPPK